MVLTFAKQVCFHSAFAFGWSMDENKVHFRHILLFYFRQGKTAPQALREISAVYGAEAITEKTCRRWFGRFHAGDFNLDDAPRSGRPTTIPDDKILGLIQSDPQLTTQEIADKFNICRTTVGDRLRKLGMVKKGDMWVPH